LHEVKDIERVFAKLKEFNLSIDDYFRRAEESASGERQPSRFEIVYHEGEDNERVLYMDNLSQIAPAILESGKHGLELKRFKGLGEMEADQLWETTMNPENRVLLRVTWDAASDAEKLFGILMGEEVEPRRKFIEDHALEVKNLDV
jgi:DNA gyrase subunit B